MDERRGAELAMFAIGDGVVARRHVLRASQPRATAAAFASPWAASLRCGWHCSSPTLADVPHAPVFVPRNFDVRTANWWEILSRALGHGKDGPPGAGRRRRTAGRSRDIRCCRPRSRASRRSARDVTDIYAIGIAGWAEQDFSSRSSTAGWRRSASVLPIKGRMVRLINHRDTVRKFRSPICPICGGGARGRHGYGQGLWRSFSSLMTSHGYERLCAAIARQVSRLTPQQIAATLDSEAIRDRVVIVSACYFGNFCAAAGKRQHDRDDRGRCGTHVLRLRSRARLDVFRRRLLSSQPASGLRSFESAFNQSPHPDPWLGNDGPRDAVKSAGLVLGGRWSQSSPRSLRQIPHPTEGLEHFPDYAFLDLIRARCGFFGIMLHQRSTPITPRCHAAPGLQRRP